MLVVIKDETTGRDISINLTIEQYQRAQRGKFILKSQIQVSVSFLPSDLVIFL